MKGFVGGIPLALLVAAVQVQAMETGTVIGGTAMGGPSGQDEDGSFTSPYSANVHTHTNVNEHYKDNHSINIKDKTVYPPPNIAFGPGAGPFAHADGPGAGPFHKRSWPSGGTAEGGPSGNDEGQSFNMPITGIFHTDVNEYSKDDHSIHVKNKDIHPGPIIVAPVHPPPEFAGPPNGPGGHSPFREANSQTPEKFHLSAEAFSKRGYPGGTAMGGPSGGDGPSDEEEFPVIAGGTAMGGPSGDDKGIDDDFSQTADIHTNVNEDWKDDHSINIKHKDVYPAPSHPPFGLPFKRSLYPHGGGGTAMGGPSGNDGGQSFDMPITVETDTTVNEAYQDDHSIHLKHKDVYQAPHFHPGPFPRAYSPDREGGDDDDFDGPVPVSGGTAEGGPSGDDDGESFGAPTNIGVDTNVNTSHDDNHAIKLDTTTVHPSSWDFHPVAAPVQEVPQAPVETAHEEVPEMPWMTYTEQQHAASVPLEAHTTPQAPEHHDIPAAPEHHEIPAPSEPAPPVHRVEHEETSQCSAQVHEVVRTVTETQYKQVHATETVYQQVPVSQAVQTSAVPMSAIPMQSAVPMQSGSDPKILSFAAPARSSSDVASASYAWPSKSASAAPSAKYSQIPVYVPVATPSSSAAWAPSATPAVSMNIPSGVSPEQSARASKSAHATPSAAGTMFTGAASRVSGGLVSAAAAVVGVLAFVL
ncbi:hypothetical protein N7466_007684 [Penicillium verhagenii]|uniref:uncharacterized protein n=1 Tax=Penicillium verhagenii TaxID=1562060 RepID=UPI0025453C43|nr:uncharacterized protein N7466_007684 [Penicillium verhagenii]KAJ5928728.1 hypothetical protein N7466_007684 [Penicillium verhagenii]